MPESINGNKYIITGMEMLTRWPIAKAVKQVTAYYIANFIYEEIVTRYGCPTSIITDNGKNFTSSVLELYLKCLKVKHSLTTPYNSQSKGMLERWQGPLQKSIVAYSGRDPKSWDKYLDQTLFAWRTKTHSATKCSPFYLMYGIEPILPGNRPILPPRNLVKARESAVKELEIFLEEIERIKSDNNDKVNRNLNNKPVFKINDRVLLKNMTKRKNQFKWIGPLKVKCVSPTNLTYRLAYPSGLRLRRPINQKS